MPRLFEQDPPDGHLVVRPDDACVSVGFRAGRELKFHSTPQDTSSEGWRLLLDLVDRAASDGRETFAPRAELPVDLWPEMVRLPPTIRKLTEVRKLDLYGSHLVAVPPEIGEMSSLATFDPYTSYRLHWFPYEITRCPKLRSSRVSTRALYGNPRTGLPFPRLPVELPADSVPVSCSVCRRAFDAGGPLQRWISLTWSPRTSCRCSCTPCSDACIDALPPPAPGYLDRPHTGGPETVIPRKYD